MKQTGFDFGAEARKPTAAAPVAAKPDLLAVGERPADWRAPSKGEEACAVCTGAACYAMGPTAWCRHHVPPGFLPGSR